MKTHAAFAAALLAACGLPVQARAQQAPLKVGLMLPFTGTFAALGTTIENGFRLQLAESGGKLAGREIQFFKVDDESDPSKATIDSPRGKFTLSAQRNPVQDFCIREVKGSCKVMAGIAVKALADPGRGCRN